MLAGVPRQGGASWAVLQYVLGLRRLGHEVLFVEEVEPARFTEAAAVRLRALAKEFDLGVCALLERGTGVTAPGSREQLLRAVAGADLLLNLSGTLTDADVLAAAGLRVYVDLDPAFTQLWHAADGVDMGFDHHERFVTVGRQIGLDGCGVPTCGRDWITTAPPIVLERWPVGGAVVHHGLTTVAHWRAYGSIHHDGVHYGQKAHALRPLIDIPSQARARFTLALGIHPDERRDLDALQRHGWQLVDPDAVAATPAAYHEFVQGSWAELGVAKLGYVTSRCGWFSDRSVCYLASGRPVVAHDTGFSEWLPTGEGLFAFRTAADVATAVEEIRGDYPRHCAAARALAETVFDSDRVLPELLACL
ncbi:MAG TPA: hypothetical protein VG295_09315 [Solirubrobacteraceae bacterium]|nr:hypothetical protein [Solirubrobacteraceae bacterium]